MRKIGKVKQNSMTAWIQAFFTATVDPHDERHKALDFLDTHMAHRDTPNKSLTFSLIPTARETQRKVPLLGFPVWFVLQVEGSFGLKGKKRHSMPTL